MKAKICKEKEQDPDIEWNRSFRKMLGVAETKEEDELYFLTHAHNCAMGIFNKKKEK